MNGIDILLNELTDFANDVFWEEGCRQFGHLEDFDMAVYMRIRWWFFVHQN
ncbi:hypothetical protein LCGC14_2197590 [marine sediment metagenome]|uniref:Uncharacterized protein n=1 Tax=marine sediment metagenome TaxID=412755 RepID=A0A0F9DHN9_9ZZZZ